MGDTSWSNAAGTDPLNSQWIVFGYENWNYLVLIQILGMYNF